MTPGRREALLLTATGLAAAAAGFLVGPLFLGKDEGLGQLGGEGLLDLTGKPRRLAEWEGRVLVCNFWATWCAPCREEIPLLAIARDRYAKNGVEVVGIAIDLVPKVVEFARSFKISYPILTAELTGTDLMRRMGNRSGGLPFTVLFDRKGEPQQRKLGALKPGELDSLLAPLLRG
jgi:thiol-disulfide isomerase/thioredoxin